MELGAVAPNVGPTAVDGENAVAIVDNGPFECRPSDIGADPVNLGLSTCGAKSRNSQADGRARGAPLSSLS
jgi:hypothetical protein